MILSTLSESRRYQSLHPRFSEAISYLESVASENFSAGRHEIAGDDVFAIAWEGFGKGPSEAVLECHRNYIDIQFVVWGVDVIGWRDRERCERTKQTYDEASDLEFFFDQPDTWIRVAAGSLAILYPEDAHAPLSANHPLKKIVVKVKID